jgi:nifR3 family TIM-barrel protein
MIPFLPPNPASPSARPVLLAPMAGFTDAAMRRVSHAFGAALTYTEMVNATGLLRASDKTWHLLETLPGEGPVVAHLYGSEPEEMAAAAAAVWRTGRFVAIDINAGCPVRKITANGCGSALMPQPDLIGRIVAAMRAASPLPVTVKTRVGLAPDRVLIHEIVSAVEEAGAAALALHARFASQMHSGAVALELLAAVKQRARIPIIGNGGIRSAADAVRMVRETGVDAVMVGRAAMGNPWLFRAIADALAAPEDAAPPPRPRPGVAEIRAALSDHLTAARELQIQIRSNHRLPSRALDPEAVVVVTFRCHLFRYLSGLAGAAQLRGHLCAYTRTAEILAAVDACLEREAQARAIRSSAPSLS